MKDLFGRLTQPEPRVLTAEEYPVVKNIIVSIASAIESQIGPEQLRKELADVQSIKFYLTQKINAVLPPTIPKVDGRSIDSVLREVINEIKNTTVYN